MKATPQRSRRQNPDFINPQSLKLASSANPKTQTALSLLSQEPPLHTEFDPTRDTEFCVDFLGCPGLADPSEDQEELDQHLSDV